jgi:hypothetical protein
MMTLCGRSELDRRGGNHCRAENGEDCLFHLVSPLCAPERGNASRGSAPHQR